jgi:hypothetical protein
MDNGILPRQVSSRLELPGPVALTRQDWAFSHNPPARPVKMPSERLIRAVLANMDSWIQDLIDLERVVIPGNKARVMHLKLNMLQAKISFMRLLGASEAEIDAALAGVNRKDLSDNPGEL